MKAGASRAMQLIYSLDRQNYHLRQMPSADHAEEHEKHLQKLIVALFEGATSLSREIGLGEKASGRDFQAASSFGLRPKEVKLSYPS